MNLVNAANKQEIDLIHALLEKQQGQLYADIWKVGVNLSLRISDLLTVRYDDLNLSERSLRLVESKTQKTKIIRLNQSALAVIERRKAQHPNGTWLFEVQSNRAKHQPISRISVSRAFKKTGDLLGLKINTHSMRKSRGMAMYQDGVPVEKIARVLNHSNTTSTLRYLGITQEEILKTYDEYEL